MSWVEIKEPLKRTNTVLVPLGNLEQHGPHCPVGSCFFLADMTGRLIGEKAKVPVTPTIPFGVSNPYKNFPGSLNVSTEILHNLVKAVSEDLIHHGFKKIIFLSAHGGGNLPTLRRVSEELREEKGTLFAIVHLWGLLMQFLKNHTEQDVSMGHGGDPVTSVMLYLKPDLVDMTQARWDPLKTPIAGMSSVSHSTQKFKNINISIPLFGEEVSEIGVYANPTKASKEKGEKIYNLLIDYLVEFVQNFENLPPPKVPIECFKNA
jgi:creatinine amidohydrolase